MRVVDITMEKKMYLSMQAIVTEREFKKIKNGKSPLLQSLKSELDSGNGCAAYEYAVADGKGNMILDWVNLEGEWNEPV